MSKVIVRSKPARRAARAAPSTPPAGPERIVRAAKRPAAEAEIIPPPECITRSRRGESDSLRRSR